ncbi:hypothetical protein LEP1GSC040_2737 [Leptospira santarosai str. 2000030832]|nr:hypothetical protein LEP1GSC040_2737 [Leptospira santarosai str. 2000030832]
MEDRLRFSYAELTLNKKRFFLFYKSIVFVFLWELTYLISK